MKIDREEKRSLKRLLVGILVAAMVITMLPIGGIREIKAEAAEISSLQDVSPFNENTKVVLVTTIDDFFDVLNGNFLAGDETYNYANGVIIKLGADLDFLVDTGKYIEYNGINIPNFPVGIDMGVYNLINISYLSYVGEQSLTMSEEYSYNFLVRGNGSNVFSFYPQKGDFGDEQNICLLDNQMQVVFSGVDVQNVVLTANSGCAFGYNDYYYEVPSYENGQDDIKLVYDSNVGIGIYRTVWSEGSSEAEIYVDELYVEEDVEVIDVSKAMGYGSIYNYTQEAVESIPSDVTLIYNENYFPVECPNPGTAFRVDSRYGLYTVSNDGKVMTLYAVCDGGVTINNQPIADFTTQTGDNGEEELVLQINGNFYSKVVQDGKREEIPCETVYFTSSAIPTEVVEKVWIGEETSEVTYPLTEVFICETTYDFYSKTHFIFDASQHTGLNIYNEPDLVKASFSGGAEENSIWSGVNADLLFGRDTLEEYENTLEPYKNQQTLFAKMGTPYVVKLKPGYTISNIQYGGFVFSDTVYDYSNGYRAEASNIVPYADGTVEFIIPGFTSAIDFTVEAILEMESLPALESKALAVDDNQIYWYNTELNISMDGYEVYDVTTNKNGASATSILETEEGIHEKEYYFINKTLDEDGVSPSSDYGKIVAFKHKYVLDTATPTITSVIATGANGEVVPVEGGWLANDENASVSAELVWTNSPSVTLNATAVQGDGLPVAEYKFVRAIGDDADGDWQISNTYTYTGDGMYDVYVHAKDEFDLGLERIIGTREEAGVWVTTFGIDTTMPTLLFTDGKNPTASALKSNTEYEGNLHMVCDDGEGSGFASINLSKKIDGQWVVSDELLVIVDEEFVIQQTIQNEVYKIELTDQAGNKTEYENITVVGYEQDVEITTGATTAIYGDVFEIEVTVKNISENPLDISKFELREDATDDVFEMDANTVTELAAGQSFTTKIRLPKGTNAGSYNAMFDMEYTNMDEDEGQHVSKVYSHQVVATIDKADAQGTVSVEDMVYGETVNVTVSSDTHGTEGITVSYKKADAEDATYATDVPTDAGEYKVKVVFAETTNYKELVVEKEFTIEKANAKGTVAVEDIVYGEKVNVVVSSDTHVTEDIIVYYKAADAEDSAYATAVPVNAGAYKVKVVFEETANYKELVVETEFTIEKAEGSASVTVDDFYYGQTPTTTVASTTNGTENVTIYYKKADADDTTYVTDVPRQTGTYKVKAVFPENANYKEVVAEDEFVITRISETRGMYSISLPNEDGIYEGPIVITGRDGNLVSVSEQSGFKEQIVINGSVGFFRFFIKTPDGAITEAVILRNIVIKVPPVKVTIGRAHLDSGEAYEFGAGTWNVSGDSTNYAGGIVFYVPASGEYEFTQQGGGQ